MADKKLILVVDDEPDTVTGMTALFEDNGFATITASNGEEAFEKAESEQPDLITLDITMDKQSGMRALKNLQTHEKTKDIPIIIVTGVSPDLKGFIDKTKGVQAPAGFMEKPVDRDALVKKAKELTS